MTMSGRAPHQLRAACYLVLSLAGIAVLAAPAATAVASRPVPILTAIRAAHYSGHDRLVFQFAGSLPSHRTHRYVRRLPAGDSGTSVSGGARLQVSFSRATGRDSQGRVAYGLLRRSFALPGVIQVATTRDHGGVVSFVVGVARREPFHLFVLTRPSRVVIDVQTPYRTVQVRDFFVNSRRATGAIATQAVGRPVIAPASASGALRRLFACPTQGELARGLQFVASGATGFRGLTIRGGVARVQLAGGCSAGGSAVTVAAEIMPTVRQFRSVRWVKIYDPAGNTERPTGDTDSIPICLEAATSLWTTIFRAPLIIALVVVAVLGILLGLALTVLSVVTGLARHPHLITPSAYRAERVKAKPVGTGQFEPDLAWPGYPFRQVRADLSRIEADRRARYRKLWNWPFTSLIWFLLFPISAAALGCLLVAGLTTVALAALFALVTWTCVAVSAATIAATATVLRGAEKCWHKVMRTEASCPHCYHVTLRPAYRCPGCAALHRDIRPGRLGLLARRCDCGTLLPTMVLRAAWRLEAVCQRCGKPLRVGSAALRDVRIPIFGVTSAGKTRFLYAALDSLVDVTSRAGIALGFPDEESENEATVALDLIRSGNDTVKTSLTLPTALTCRIGTGAKSTLVHLFDAAGEYFQGAEMHDSLGFLDHGHGLVYVLDPFSIGSVRDQMTGQNAVAKGLANAASGDPEAAYTEVVSRLRDSGVAAQQQRLAIVVSKVDLLSAGGLELPDDSDTIAQWLTQQGVHNLVLSARREFAEVRYFAVASLAAAETGRSHDPGSPLRWLLSSRGVQLPGDPHAPRSPRIVRRPNRPDPADQLSAEHDPATQARP